MCWMVAIPIVMAVVSAASTAMAVKATNDQAAEQNKSTAMAREMDYSLQNQQQQQVNTQAAQEETNRMRQAMIERAQIRVAQGESGVAGISSNKEFSASLFGEQNDIAVIRANAAGQVNQIQNEKMKTKTTADSRFHEANSAMKGPLSAGLQIGMSAVSGAMSGMSAMGALSGPTTPTAGAGATQLTSSFGAVKTPSTPYSLLGSGGGLKIGGPY